MKLKAILDNNMNSLLKNYPPYLRFLLPVLVLQQAVFFLFFQQADLHRLTEIETEEVFLGIGFIQQNYYLLAGIISILSGFLCDYFNDMRKVLLYSISGLLLGHSLVMIPLSVFTLLGGLIYLISFSIFSLKLLLNITILFPVANDFKDNSITVSILLPILVIAILQYIISAVFSFESYSVVLFCTSIIIYLLLLYSVYYNQDLGYKIIEEEIDEEEKAHLSMSRWVLLGAIILSFLTLFSSSYLTYFTTQPSTGNGLDDLLFSLGYQYQIGSIFLIVATVSLLIYLFFKAKPYSNQVSKIMIGLVSLIGLYFFDLGNYILDSWLFEYFVNAMPYYIGNIFITIPAISIITHLNYSRKPSLYLGLLIGCPYILIYMVDLTVTFYGGHQIASVISFLFVIGAFIYLKENRNFISEKLALDTPNQEIEIDSEEEDPFDHLVEN